MQLRAPPRRSWRRRGFASIALLAYVRTPMFDHAAGAITDFEQIEKRQFLGIIEPEEIGIMAAYLLSSAARSITGSQFVMDGGFTL